mmetsp:Transcript_40959/g.80791  ORF Transcript_40959/g.80791 Transcript_40959/m.80791 type:complete len:164 (+) Transcript_40959:701-1192(+)
MHAWFFLPSLSFPFCTKKKKKKESSSQSIASTGEAQVTVSTTHTHTHTAHKRSIKDCSNPRWHCSSSDSIPLFPRTRIRLSHHDFHTHTHTHTERHRQLLLSPMCADRYIHCPAALAKKEKFDQIERGWVGVLSAWERWRRIKRGTDAEINYAADLLGLQGKL